MAPWCHSGAIANLSSDDDAAIDAELGQPVAHNMFEINWANVVTQPSPVYQQSNKIDVDNYKHIA